MDGYVALISARIDFGDQKFSVGRGVSHATLGPVQVAGDVRLDEIGELRRRFDAPHASDLELVAHAYLTWGDALGEHLFGEYAFVVFDARDASVLAVRDHAGLRPLAHRRVGATLYVARDPAALAHATNPAAPLDADEVRFFLTGEDPSATRTMFRGVTRLPPGHALRATQSGERTWRHWRPLDRALRSGTNEEHRAELRRLLDASVARAIERRPVLVHASGGLDSSSVAALASRTPNATHVHLVHGYCEGADERRWVRDLAHHLSRPIEDIVATPSDEIDDAIDTSHIYRYPLAAVSHGIERIAKREGARAILTGLGGDEVFFERGIFRDLAARRRLRELASETLGNEIYSSRGGRFFLRDAFVGLLPPFVRAARERLRPRPKRPWLRLASNRAEGSRENHRASSRTRFTSHVQRTTWEWLTNPTLAAALETEERGLRAIGMDLSAPLLDRRICELVLALPFEQRIPHGRMKAILRDAMGDALPESVRERRTVMAYDDAISHAIAAKLPALRRVVQEGPWRAEPFVDRHETRRLLETLDARSPALADALPVWDIVSLELWLRARA